MSQHQHILIFRFSSLGDVAMTVPVIRNLLQQHPGLRVTMVSAAFHAPLFAGMERLRFVAADLKGRHKGPLGLLRLFRELSKEGKIDAVADLHNVLRTRILRLYFSLTGIPWVSQDKGRREKKELTRSSDKILRPLKSTFQRYADVFTALGLPVQLDVAAGRKTKGQVPPVLAALKSKGKQVIGIAPLAQFERKTYPAEKMKALLRMLAQDPQLVVYLLGGKGDLPLLRSWATEIHGLQVAAGAMNFVEELDFIAHLDVVVSMDSANMHLASMFGVPVVSIWGATHPYAGFYGWGQEPANAVQIALDCRPCSVFGNKAGPREDLACMHGITPLAVYHKIAGVLHNTPVAKTR